MQKLNSETQSDTFSLPFKCSYSVRELQLYSYGLSRKKDNFQILNKALDSIKSNYHFQ